MAEHALSTDRRSHEPARGAVDRRTIGAALFAVVAGSGVTAGAAASVADLVPAELDVDLIAACNRALLANEQSSRITARFANHTCGADPVIDSQYDAAFEEAWRIVGEDYHPSIARAASLSALTRSGLEAKARLLLLSLDDPDDEDALAASLARDVLSGRA